MYWLILIILHAPVCAYCLNPAFFRSQVAEVIKTQWCNVNGIWQFLSWRSCLVLFHWIVPCRKVTRKHAWRSLCIFCWKAQKRSEVSCKFTMLVSVLLIICFFFLPCEDYLACLRGWLPYDYLVWDFCRFFLIFKTSSYNDMTRTF